MNRAATHVVRNAFLSVGAPPPDGVVVLNGPHLGQYEEGLLRRWTAKSVESTSGSTSAPSARSPLIICADGAYNRLSKDLRRCVDVVCGDMDSLRSPPPPSTTIVLPLLADLEAVTRASLRDHGPAPAFIRVVDQDSTDSYKCLELSRALLRAPLGSAPVHPRRKLVVCVGFTAGRHDHEFATFASALKFAADDVIEVRLHSPQNTIAFCLPSGRTIFEPTSPVENGGVALVPLGPTPSRLITQGLQWNVDWDAARDVGVLNVAPFGFSGSRSIAAYISTSNRLALVKEDQGPQRCVIDVDQGSNGMGGLMLITSCEAKLSSHL